MNKLLLEIAEILSSKRNLENLETMPLSGFGEIKIQVERESPVSFKISQIVETRLTLKELKELQAK